MTNNSLPRCPCCDGEKFIPSAGCSGRKIDRKPCDVCNGTGKVTLAKFADFMENQ